MEQPSFWVVETARTTYWDGRRAGREAAYTSYIGEAMKFHTFNDAERARCWLLEPEAHTLRGVEHMFIRPPISLSPGMRDDDREGIPQF